MSCYQLKNFENDITVPLVSVVIPSYNAERWIKSTLDSVLAQTHSDIEIIVVDDGSTDDTVAVISEFFPSVKLITQTNSGVAAARNKGIENASGEWIAFLDADDIWLPNKVQDQLELLATEPDAQMTYSAWHVWPSQNPTPDSDLLFYLQNVTNENDFSGPSGWIYPELLEDCYVWTSTVLAKKTLFEKIGKFDVTLKVGEDYDLWLRASQTTKILRVAKPHALYRIHPTSLTKKTPLENYQAIVINRSLAKWGYSSTDGRIASKENVNKTLARSWLNFADAKFRADKKEIAFKSVLLSLRLNFYSYRTWLSLAKFVIKSLR